jgi:hypothetical protein
MGIFRQFLENLNKLMYDLDSEEGRKSYEDDLAWLKDFHNRPKRQEIKREHHKTPLILICWSGCSKEHLDRLTVQKGQGFRILDPSKSRSRAMWFTHRYLTGGKDLAQSHNQGVLITYPLSCVAYYDLVTYNDGTDEEPSKQMLRNVSVFSECPWTVLGTKVINVPQGWAFSEERYLLCEKPLRIDDNMIT